MEQLNEMWKEDGKLRLDQLLEEKNRDVTLHAKYTGLLYEEKKKLRDMATMVGKFQHKLTRMLQGHIFDKADHEYAKSQGWIPPEGKLDRFSIKPWVENCDEMIKLNMELAEQTDIVEFLEGIVQKLKYRGHDTNHAIKMKIHNDGG